MDWAKQTVRRDEKHLCFGIGCGLYQMFCDISHPWCSLWDIYIISYKIKLAVINGNERAVAEHQCRVTPRIEYISTWADSRTESRFIEIGFYPPISGQPDSRELCVRVINVVVCQVRGPTFSRGHRIKSVISFGLNNLSRELAFIATILKSQDCLHHDVFMSWAILWLIGAMLNCSEKKPT